MKKIIVISVFIALIALALVGFSSCGTNDGDGGNVITLNVYNWGEYMPLDSDEDGFAVNEEFEKWYEEKYGQKIKVN